MRNEELNDIRATPIEDVAKKLGIEVGRHKALCPFHEDRHPSLHFKNNRFKCFACGASGDVIDLVQRYLNIGFKEAVESSHLTSPRGGTKNALCEDGSGRSNQSLLPGGDGGGLPRLRFPRGSHVGMYNKPVIRRLKPGDELWITEGPSDCWAMLSAGHKAVAIPSATSLTRADVGLLRDGLPEGVSLHMYPDNDEPGMKLFEDLRRWFPELHGHVLPEGCKDFGEAWRIRN